MRTSFCSVYGRYFWLRLIYFNPNLIFRFRLIIFNIKPAEHNIFFIKEELNVIVLLFLNMLY